jgi:type IV pilus assembly protein PilA
MQRKGFTVVELLIVVVIIGILAVFAISKSSNSKSKAYVASMRADLRSLVSAEEAYFQDSVKYGTSLSCTIPTPTGKVGFCATTGNTLGTVTVATGTQAGWTTTMTNRNTTTSCAVYVGTITPDAPATSTSQEGAPVCH